MRKDLLLR